MFRYSDVQPAAVIKRRPEPGNITGRFKIQKSDDEKRLAFGWAGAAANINGETVEDCYGDIIEIEELEQAAYAFVELYREGGEMHERGGCAVLVESIVFTPEKIAAMGIPEGTVPTGWWIGFKVTDYYVSAKVTDGRYPMFSIEGSAVRVPAEEGDDNAAN